ncbi:hypothetical protein PsYK624_128690 [Phanerochaete sordida]|uniref:Uncharacterized protein n=1 Tax=Phanerochaete sordida TaxID=48140 RepID=A0A9P3GJI2_9APHY|nr:hypothetical protein PsYK624_128690 [Phanerochaete sordida]
MFNTDCPRFFPPSEAYSRRAGKGRRYVNRTSSVPACPARMRSRWYQSYARPHQLPPRISLQCFFITTLKPLCTRPRSASCASSCPPVNALSAPAPPPTLPLLESTYTFAKRQDASIVSRLSDVAPNRAAGRVRLFGRRAKHSVHVSRRRLRDRGLGPPGP